MQTLVYSKTLYNIIASSMITLKALQPDAYMYIHPAIATLSIEMCVCIQVH